MNGLRVLVVAIVVASLLTVPEDAWAFWRRETSCGNQTTIDYGFSNDPEWTSTFKTAVNRAFGQWTSAAVLKDVDGTRLYSRGGSAGYTARWDDLGETYARVVCGGFNLRNVEFNRNRRIEYENQTLDLQGIATHEFGHAFGLSHSGTSDGSVPTMGTCNGEVETAASRTLALDDVAAAAYRTDVVNSWSTGNANSSFEHGGRYWRTVGSPSSFKIRSDGGSAGPRYARLVGTLVQEVEMVEGWNFAHRISIRHRRPAGGTDYFTVYLHTNPVDYRDAVSNRCQWPKDADGTRQDLNKRKEPYPSWAGAALRTCYPASSWNTCVTDFAGDITSTSGPDALIAEIRVANNSCCYPVDIDLARVQVRWPAE